jgi:hypothetical protein
MPLSGKTEAVRVAEAIANGSDASPVALDLSR